VGRGAAAVPLVLDGLATAAEQFGLLELAQLVAPGVELARDGVVIDAITARTFHLLWPILRRDPECLAEIAEGLPQDRRPQAAQRVRSSGPAATPERYATLGRAPPALRDRLPAEFGPDRGGMISAADLDAARVAVGAPHRFQIGEWKVA